MGDTTIRLPEKGEDGRIHHWIRQSTLTSYVYQCAEQVRLLATGAAPSRTTSSALIGTAVHAGIELCINEIIASAHPCDPEDQIEAAMAAWDAEECVMLHSDTEARGLIIDATRKWRDQIMGDISPIRAELTFKDLVLFEDDQRVIHANGTIDLIDDSGIADWKTSATSWLPKPRQKITLLDGSTRWVGGGKSKRTEKEQSDLQSTLYLWAAKELGYECGGNFTFVVMVHGQEEIETISVKRTPAHLDWLRKLAVGFAIACEHTLADQWHIADSGWWCSDKWCPAWGICKGTVFSQAA